MPGHLQYFGGRVARTFVWLASRNLGQIVDLLGEFGFDDAQRLEKLLCMIFGRLLAGLFFAELLERLTLGAGRIVLINIAIGKKKLIYIYVCVISTGTL